MNENGLQYNPDITESRIENKDSLSVYIDSEFTKMLNEQRNEKSLTAALFTDIDNTFYRADRDWPSKVLYRDLTKENYPMAAVTGNSFSGIEKRIRSGELPYFPIIAGAVGTEIYVLHEENGEKTYRKDEEYEKFLHETGYDRVKLAKKAWQMIEDMGEKDQKHKGSYAEWKLGFQEPNKEKEIMEGKKEAETPFKLSLFAFASSNESLESLRSEISKRFPEQRVIICEEINYNSKMLEGDTNKKYNIDILPITKGEAVDYIANKTDVDIKVVAGDSGNDAEMILNTKEGVSIIVGGAKPDLVDTVDRNILKNEINKDIEEIRDNDGKIKKIYYREIGTGRGPESILKVFKMLKNIQKNG